MQVKDIKSIAIIGAGTIGASWATLFATNGLDVRLHDNQEDALSRARELIECNLRGMVQGELVSTERKEKARVRIKSSSRLEDTVCGSDAVVECVVEDLEIKRMLFKRIEQICSPRTILLSSSSGLPIGEIHQVLANPCRCLVASPWNPPHLVPLVEMVPGKQTDPEVTAVVKSFFESIGQEPIVLRKVVTGHVGNRLAAALWREAIDLVHRGVVTVEDVETAVRAGLGIRFAIMGPNMIYHLGGGPDGLQGFLHHLRPAFEQWMDSLADWSCFPKGSPEKLITGVREMTENRSYQDLVTERDAKLIAIRRVLEQYEVQKGEGGDNCV